MDRAGRTEDKATQTHEKRPQAAYEPPELTVLGTIEELTQIEDINGQGNGSKPT